jgi:hypothetical protein
MMNAITERAILVAIMLLVMEISCVAPTSAYEGTGSYYPLSVGDKWTYRWARVGSWDLGGWIQNQSLTAEQIDEVDGMQQIGNVNAYVLNTTAWDSDGMLLETALTYLAWQDGRLLSYRHEEHGWVIDFDPPRLYLDTPLDVGHSWSWNGKSTSTGISQISTFTENNEVTGKVLVTVPAGTYEAYEVRTEMKMATDVTNQGQVNTHRWLVEGIGLVKEEVVVTREYVSSYTERITDYESRELISYQVSESEPTSTRQQTYQTVTTTTSSINTVITSLVNTTISPPPYLPTVAAVVAAVLVAAVAATIYRRRRRSMH